MEAEKKKREKVCEHVHRQNSQNVTSATLLTKPQCPLHVII